MNQQSGVWNFVQAWGKWEIFGELDIGPGVSRTQRHGFGSAWSIHGG